MSLLIRDSHHLCRRPHRTRWITCAIVPTVNPGHRHAPTHRGIPGRGVAPAGLTRKAQGRSDEMGIDSGTRRAVFLDRDGVINRPVIRDGKPYPPARVEELEVLPGTRDALLRLRASDFRLVVVTNQPDVARGTQRREVVDAMHAQLAAALPIDEFRVCAHDDSDDCACRKPKPGLLEAAAEEGGLSLVAS